MKYPSLLKKDALEYNVSGFDSGVSFDRIADTIDDAKLSDCKNMWYYKGRLSTRSGFAPIFDKPLELLDTTLTQFKNLTITDTIYSTAEGTWRLAYLICGEITSYRIMKFYLVSASSTRSIGEIYFNRVTSDYFAEPINAFFVVGNPTVGSGIYAFITRSCNGESSYAVYEASLDLSEWQSVSSEFYVPVIYANGQGTRYNEAHQLSGINYDAPIEPEQRNLLDGHFKAYFTSDGLSSMFRLPVSNLDADEPVVCRVYKDSQSYTEWVIPAGGTSDTKTFQDNQVTVSCDRKLGSVWFSTVSGYCSVPIMPYCSTNNIMITAVKTVLNGVARVAGSKRCTVFNSRVYVCGNSVNPHEVYSARLTNPLYFPKNSKAIVGESTSAVTALGVQSNKLIAFKSNEIYRINVTEGKSLFESTTILGENDEFLEPDTLESQTVHTTIGCDCPDTVRLCGNRLVWLSSSGGVYTLTTTTYGNENNVYEISMDINTKFQEFQREDLRKAVAIDNRGCYILVCGKLALVMDYKVQGFGYSAAYSTLRNTDKGIAWYLWELPQSLSISSGFNDGGVTVVAGCDDSGRLFYLLTMSSDKDRLLCYGDGVEICEENIKSSFCTKMFDFNHPERYKGIEAVYITANSEGAVDITLTDNTQLCRRSIHLPKTLGTVRITPLMKPTERLSVSASAEAPMSVYGMKFKYKLTTDIR